MARVDLARRIGGGLMPKRGESLPYRVTFQWDNGVKGSSAHRTLDAATDAALALYRAAKAQDRTVTVKISERRA